MWSQNKSHVDAAAKDTGLPITPLYTEPWPAIVPEAWKLVPLEPTKEMVEAGANAAREYLEIMGGNSPTVTFRAMLAAAPDCPR